MTQPQNAKEYLERFHAHQRVSGFGISGMQCHVPCPFCAAKDWLVHNIIDTKDAYERGATCNECGRSAKTIVKSHDSGHIAFEIVQTGGDDPPYWLTPKMRRVDG